MVVNLGLSGVFGAEQRCDYLEGPFITFKATIKDEVQQLRILEVLNSFKKKVKSMVEKLQRKGKLMIRAKVFGGW